MFLEPGARKYPVKVKRDGAWKYDKDLLLAAARRARQQGNDALASRADKIREREFEAKADAAGRGEHHTAHEARAKASYEAAEKALKSGNHGEYDRLWAAGDKHMEQARKAHARGDAHGLHRPGRKAKAQRKTAERGDSASNKDCAMVDAETAKGILARCDAVGRRLDAMERADAEERVNGRRARNDADTPEDWERRAEKLHWSAGQASAAGDKAGAREKIAKALEYEAKAKELRKRA